ncbi:YhdP family protein [Hahella sp. CCB-MM4]|uniref:YhdP family protein n=1 Tax=Hahella sp. (strain CCB-MM4) TaxID=1926491 RepID=UPI00114070FD|nr:YhdP family protein [Hahella sp. CCB-MM4]
MTFKSIVIKATQAVWYLAITLLVVVATYIALGRNFFGSVAAFKDSLEAKLNELTGVSVHIGDLRGEWDGFDPVLKLADVNIVDPTDGSTNIIELKSVMIQPDVVASLFNMGLVFRHIELGDVAVNVEQNADGSWSLTGFPALSDTQESEWEWEGFNDLLASPTFEFRDIRIHWKFRNISSTTWLIPIMKLQTGEQGLQASGFIHQLDDNEPLGIFSLAERVDQSADGLNADLYLAWRNSALLNPLMEMLESRGTRVTGFQSKGSAWIHIGGGQVEGLTTEVDVTDVQWQRQYEAQDPIQHIAGRFRVEKEDDDWHMRASDLQMDWKGQSLELGRLVADMQLGSNGSGSSSGGANAGGSANVGESSNAGGKHVEAWQLQFDRINVGFLKDLAVASGLLPDKLHRSIQNYSPEGWLNNLKISNQHGDVEVAAELESVTVAPHGGAPGGEEISGYMEATGDHGVVMFHGDQLSLNFPELFFDRWTFQYGEGVVRWRLFDDYTYVSGQNISLNNPNHQRADLRGKFSILIPQFAEETGSFELAIGIKNTDATLTPTFVPGHIVSPELYSWLENAVLAGTITEGGYLYSGAVGSHAQKGTYRSQMYFNLEDAALKFSEAWPVLTDFDGRLSIDDGHITGTVYSGELAVSHVEDVDLEMASTVNGEHLLKIHTRLNPDAEDWKYWLFESPVAEHTKPVVNGWDINGDSEIELAVETNLDREETKVQLGAEFKDMNLYLEDYKLGLLGLKGAFQFDSDMGVYAEKLEADVFGGPAIMKLSTRDWSSDSKGVQLNVSGKAPAEVVAQRADLGEDMPLQGEFDYDFRLAVNSGKKTKFDLTFDSDLVGTSILLPPPLQKTMNQSRPLKARYQWNSDRQQGLLDVSVKNLMSMQLFSDAKGINRGLVKLLQSGKDDIPVKGVDVVGRLDHLDANLWQDYLNRQSSGRSDKNFQWPEWLGLVNVDIGSVKISDEIFNDASLSLTHKEDSLILTVDDQNRVKGVIRFPLSDEEVLSANFDRLYLSEKSDEKTGEMLPSDVPLGQFSINDFKLGEQEYGAWSWTAQKRDNGVVFNQVVGKLSGAVLNARLSWLYEPKTGVHNSILTGEISGKKFADLYQNWSDDAPLSAESYSMNAGLVWSRPPLDFSWEGVSGQVSMNMESGVINEASTETNLFRIFGILNTDSIIRRLKLDFSDLYKKGLAYDRIEGNARIQEGVISMETPLAIQGPSSAYKITGKTSLVDDSLDLQMVVVLPVTQNLPLAALLVGAPQVGGALYLIDKLLGEPLSSLTSATYEIKGTFQKPEMKLKQIFDQSKSPKVETGKSKAE